MLNLIPVTKIARWVGDEVPNPQNKLGSQGSPQAQRGALGTQRYDRKEATRRTTSLFTNTHSHPWLFGLISKNPCPLSSMHSQPAAWQPCSHNHPSQRPETFHVTRCSGSRELCSPPAAPTFLLRDGTKFACKTQMSYASFQTRRGRRRFPLRSSFRHSVKTSLAKWGSVCHHFSKFTFPQGRHEEEQGGEPSHECPRVTVTQDNTLKNLEGEGMWEGWRGGCLLTYKNISKGFASCEKKKGAQGNVVQAIGGKKIWKSGNPTAGVKKKRMAFSHILGSEGFPKLQEASYKFPNSLV